MITHHHDLRAALLNYLHRNGWVAPDRLGHVGGVWRHPATGDLLPVPNTIIAAGPDWQVITERLARSTGTSPAAIATLITATTAPAAGTNGDRSGAETNLRQLRSAIAELDAVPDDTRLRITAGRGDRGVTITTIDA